MALTAQIQHHEYYVANGAPVVGASVYLRTASASHPNVSAILSTTTTNADGMWTFTGLSDTADYDVEVAFSGVSRWYKGVSYTNCKIRAWNFENQGAGVVLGGNAVGPPSWRSIVTGDVANATFSDGSKFTPQTPFSVFSGPNVAGPNVTPGFRALVDGDIPTTLNSKTLVTPTIASFVNATHNHGNAANGGTALGSWNAWTPTLIQGAANATLTITEARWLLLGTLAYVQCRCAITNAGSAGNEMAFAGLPISMRSGIADNLIGQGYYFDTGTAFYTGAMMYVGLTTVKMICHNTPNALGATPNIAFASGDVFSLKLIYET